MLQFALEPLLAPGPGGTPAGEALPALTKLLTLIKFMRDAAEADGEGGAEKQVGARPWRERRRLRARGGGV